jgi:hypothetical protein
MLQDTSIRNQPQTMLYTGLRADLPILQHLEDH